MNVRSKRIGHQRRRAARHRARGMRIERLESRWAMNADSDLELETGDFEITDDPLDPIDPPIMETTSFSPSPMICLPPQALPPTDANIAYVNTLPFLDLESVFNLLTFDGEDLTTGPAAHWVDFAVVPESTANLLGVASLISGLPSESEFAGGVAIVDFGEQSAGGTLSITGDGQSLLYTPAAQFAGLEKFYVTVESADGTASWTQLLTVAVGLPSDLTDPVSHQPLTVVAKPAVFQVDNPADSNLLFLSPGFAYQSPPQTDADGVLVSPVLTPDISTTVGGTVARSADGQSFEYTSPAEFVGVDSFFYNEHSDAGDFTHLTLVVVGSPDFFATENSLPPLMPMPGDTFSQLPTDSFFGGFFVAQDSTDNVLDVLARDLPIVDDEAAPTFQIDSVTDTTAGGTVTISTDGQVLLYTPPAGFQGVDTFTYDVDLSDGGHLTAGVRVVVGFEDDAACNDYFIAQGEVLDLPGFGLFQVAANSIDNQFPLTDGETLDPILASLRLDETTSAGGTIHLSDDALAIIYTPPADFVGLDSVSAILPTPFMAFRIHAVIAVGMPEFTELAATDSADELDFVMQLVPKNSFDNIIAALPEQTAEDDAETSADSPTNVPTFEFTVQPESKAGGNVWLEPSGGVVRYSPPRDFTGVDLVEVTMTLESGESHSSYITVAVGDIEGFVPPVTMEALATADAAASNDWHNFEFPSDVSGDGILASEDVLLIVNWLNGPNGPLSLDDLLANAASGEATTSAHLDVNNDRFISPLDALMVINRLNSLSGFDTAAADVSDGEAASAQSRLSSLNSTNDEPAVFAAALWPSSISSAASLPACVADENCDDDLFVPPLSTSQLATLDQLFAEQDHWV